jgi:hypothetical protein
VFKITGSLTRSFRDLQCTSDQWWSVFLGGHDIEATGGSFRVLGHRLVQPSGASCSDDGNQVCYRVHWPRRSSTDLHTFSLPALHVPTSSLRRLRLAQTTNRTHARLSESTRQYFSCRVNLFSSCPLVPADPDAGMINTFGVRILKYLNSVSVWWHALGTTSLTIAILAAAPKHQSGKFVFRTFIDDTGIYSVGWSQRASPAYVALIGILMAQYTLTGRGCPFFSFLAL